MLDTQTVSTDLRSHSRRLHVPDKENGFQSQVTKRREVKRRGGSSHGRAIFSDWWGGGVGWQDWDTGSPRKFVEIRTKEVTGKPSVVLSYHLVSHLIQSCSKLPEHEDVFFFLFFF